LIADTKTRATPYPRLNPQRNIGHKCWAKARRAKRSEVEELIMWILDRRKRHRQERWLELKSNQISHHMIPSNLEDCRKLVYATGLQSSRLRRRNRPCYAPCCVKIVDTGSIDRRLIGISHLSIWSTWVERLEELWEGLYFLRSVPSFRITAAKKKWGFMT
jgi:hypothetical protein